MPSSENLTEEMERLWPVRVWVSLYGWGIIVFGFSVDGGGGEAICE